MIDLGLIEKAAGIIRAGGLVAFPTETVYGLGADALNPEAVTKIFIAKERPTFDPLIVHISSLADLELLSNGKDERILRLAEAFWPGPLTIVMPKSERVPDIVTSGLETVAVRMPSHPVALELIRLAGCPVAAPSANKFGCLSPTTAKHVKKQLPDIDYILDGGKTQVGIESTVITLRSDGFAILRNGVITAAEIAKIVPQSNQEVDHEAELASPGLLLSHYSPNKPIYIKGSDNLPEYERSRTGCLSFRGENITGYAKVEILSASGDLREAAVNFFHALHTLEESDIDYIIADAVPEKGIGLAIMDKLRKAAYRYQH